MTLSEMLGWIDAMRPNAYTAEQKTAWVSDLEAAVWTQLLLRPAAEWSPYTAGEDGQRRLMLPVAWRRVYAAYLGAMIDFANGEFTQYANSMSLYNACAAELGAWVSAALAPAMRPARWAKLNTVAYTGAETGAAPLGRVPAKMAVLAAECRIREAFDGGGEGFLVGTAEDEALLMDEADAGSDDEGLYRRLGVIAPGEDGAMLYATYTGGTPTQGLAEFRVLLQPAAES